MSEEILISGKAEERLSFTVGLSSQTAPFISPLGFHHVFTYSLRCFQSLENAAIPKTMWLSSVLSSVRFCPDPSCTCITGTRRELETLEGDFKTEMKLKEYKKYERKINKMTIAINEHREEEEMHLSKETVF